MPFVSVVAVLVVTFVLVVLFIDNATRPTHSAIAAKYINRKASTESRDG